MLSLCWFWFGWKYFWIHSISCNRNTVCGSTTDYTTYSQSDEFTSSKRKCWRKYVFSSCCNLSQITGERLRQQAHASDVVCDVSYGNSIVLIDSCVFWAVCSLTTSITRIFTWGINNVLSPFPLVSWLNICSERGKGYMVSVACKLGGTVDGESLHELRMILFSEDQKEDVNVSTTKSKIFTGCSNIIILWAWLDYFSLFNISMNLVTFLWFTL